MTKQTRIERMRELGQFFLFCHEAEPKNSVKMQELHFEACGTIACHAGHFAAFQGKSEKALYTYLCAADEMAEYLGFSNAVWLKRWAQANPHIWGNQNGYGMFDSSEAFDKWDGEYFTLEDIGIRWLQVADRLETNGEYFTYLESSYDL